MNQFYFPSDNYHNFKNGVDIDTPQINGWIGECITKVQNNFASDKNLKQTFCTISSGNTKVFVEAYRQQSNGKFTVFVTVTKDYSRQMECDVEL